MIQIWTLNARTRPVFKISLQMQPATWIRTAARQRDDLCFKGDIRLFFLHGDILLFFMLPPTCVLFSDSLYLVGNVKPGYLKSQNNKWKKYLVVHITSQGHPPSQHQWIFTGRFGLLCDEWKPLVLRWWMPLAGYIDNSKHVFIFSFFFCFFWISDTLASNTLLGF